MATSLKIGIVEDNEDLLTSLVELLSMHQHRVFGVTCAEELGESGGTLELDVIIVDLNLPGEDGLSLVARLKSVHPRLRVLMISTRSAIRDRVTGYDNGADIYLNKPIMEEELIATLNALARQIDADKNCNSQEVAQKLQLDLRALEMRGPRGDIPITKSEARLLSALATAPGQTLEYWQLLEMLGMDIDSAGKTALAVRIARLRSKICEVGFPNSSIKAVRASGYQLCIPFQSGHFGCEVAPVPETGG